jgi:hypothetical protein
VPRKLFGIGAGVLAAGQLSRVMGWKTAVDISSVVIAFGFATAAAKAVIQFTSAGAGTSALG